MEGAVVVRESFVGLTLAVVEVELDGASEMSVISAMGCWVVGE